jgi:hypothetical protein
MIIIIIINNDNNSTNFFSIDWLPAKISSHVPTQ